VRDLRPDTSADTTELRGQVRDLPSPARRLVHLDVFWPILAVVLVVAVIFVAAVARSSMNQVGVLVVQSSLAPIPTKPPATTPAGPIMVVQVSSHSTRGAAQAACEELISNGYKARVLNSDGYRPLNRGYFVVFIGPYSTTTAGRAAAQRVTDKIKGSLIRTLRPR